MNGSCHWFSLVIGFLSSSLHSTAGGPYSFEVTAKAKNGLNTQLTDARQMHSHHFRNLAECKFFVIVKAQNDPFLFGYSLNRHGEKSLQFGPFHNPRRPQVLVVRYDVDKVLALIVSRNEPVDLD